MSGEQRTRAERIPGVVGSSPRLPPGMVYLSEAELRKYKRLAAWGVGAALGVAIGLVIGAIQVGAALVDLFGR